jgi:hypothetical protein
MDKIACKAADNSADDKSFQSIFASVAAHLSASDGPDCSTCSCANNQRISHRRTARYERNRQDTNDIFIKDMFSLVKV